MQVAMIVHAYYLKDARVRRYAEGLVEQGHNVDVICLSEYQDEPVIETCQGVFIHRIRVSRKRGGAGSYIIEYGHALIRFFFLINKLHLGGKKFSVVHIHNFPNFLVFAAIVQKIAGAKIILDVHDPMPELFQSKYKLGKGALITKVLRYEERISIKYADLVIAANHYFKDILISRGCPPGKTLVILNSPSKIFRVMDEPLLPNSSGRREFCVLYIGTIAERYGLDTALRAVAKLKSDGSIPNIRMLVIPKIKNEGNDLEKLTEQVKSLGIADRFVLIEPVPHDDMPRIIRMADLSVYTPFPDVHMDIALSLKIPEVIACGKPLVTTRLSVLERYFGEDALFMCEAGNADDCAAKMLEIFRNPDEVRRRTEKARKTLETFNWDQQKTIYLKIIHEIA